MICNLKGNQILNFSVYTGTLIKEQKVDSFENLISYLKDSFKQNNKPEEDFINHIAVLPNIVAQLMVSDTSLFGNKEDRKKYSLDKLVDLKESFTSTDAVVQYINNLTTPLQEEIKQDVVQPEEITNSLNKVVEKKFNDARPSVRKNILGTISNEVVNNIVPQVVLNSLAYKIKDNLIDQSIKENKSFTDLGIYARVINQTDDIIDQMSDSDITTRNGNNIDLISKEDFKNFKRGKVIVLVDKEGNHLKFDENGNKSTENGNISVFSIPTLSKAENIVNNYKGIQDQETPEEFNTNLTILQAEKDTLQRIRESTQDAILEITGLSKGIIKNFEVQVINPVNLDTNTYDIEIAKDPTLYDPKLGSLHLTNDIVTGKIGQPYLILRSKNAEAHHLVMKSISIEDRQNIINLINHLNNNVTTVEERNKISNYINTIAYSGVIQGTLSLTSKVIDGVNTYGLYNRLNKASHYYTEDQINDFFNSLKDNNGKESFYYNANIDALRNGTIEIPSINNDNLEFNKIETKKLYLQNSRGLELAINSNNRPIAANRYFTMKVLNENIEPLVEEISHNIYQNNGNIDVVIKKDAKSNWNLSVKPNGEVFNTNTNIQITDKKLINKAQLKSGFLQYTKIQHPSTGVEYAVTDNKIISLAKSNLGAEIQNNSTVGKTILKEFNKVNKGQLQTENTITPQEVKQNTLPISTETNSTEINKTTGKTFFENLGEVELASFDRSKELINDQTDPIKEEDLNWFKETFKDSLGDKRELQVLNHMTNSDFWGRWTAQGVYLLNNADRGTLYHEAWHEFSQFYLTKEDKQNLYNEVKKKNNLTDLQAEEQIAEGFRNYVLDQNKPNSFSKKIKDIFSKIVSFIRNLFTVKDNVSTLYNKLYKGEINRYKADINNSNFSKLDSSILDENGNVIFNSKEIFNFSKIVDGLIFDIIHANNRNTLQVAEDTNLQSKVLNATYKTIEGRVNKIKEEFGLLQENNELSDLKSSEIQSNIYDLEKLLVPNNWNKMINYVRDYSKMWKFQGKHIDLLDNEDLEEKDVDDLPPNLYDRNGNEQSSLQSTQDGVKALIMGLKQGFDNYGFYNRVPFTKTFYKIANLLQGIHNYGDMLTKLQNVVNSNRENNLELADLLTKLKSTSEIKTLSDLLLSTQFLQTFSRTNISVNRLLYEDGTFKTIKSSKNSIREISRIASSNFISNENPSIIKDKDTEENLLNGEFFKNAISDKNFIKSKENRATLLSYLGIDLSNDTINSADFDRQTAITAVTRIGRFILDAINKGQRITDPLRILSSGYTYRDNKNNEIKVPSEKGNLNIILGLEANNNDNYSSASVIDSNGNIIYSLSLNNFTTITNTVLNDNTRFPSYQDVISVPYMSHLDFNKNSAVLNSIFMNQLFNLDTNSESFGKRKLFNGLPITLAFEDMNGLEYIKDESTIERGTSTSLTLQDKTIQKYVTLLSIGGFSMPRPGDKAQERMWQVTSWSEGNNKLQTLPMTSNQFEVSFESPKLLSTWEGYLKNELERIWKFKDPSFIGNRLSNKSQVSKFALFSEILSPDLKEDLYQGIKDAETGNDLQTLLDSNRNNVQRDILTFFENEFNTEKEFLKSENLINFDGTVSKNNMWLPQDLVNGDSIENPQLMDRIIRTYLANQLTAKVEQNILITGDLAFYKDFYKRNSAFVSTGSILADEDSIINILNDQTTEIGKNTNLLAKSLGINNQVSNIINSAVLEDVNISTRNKESLEESLRRFYKNQGHREDELNILIKDLSDKYNNLNEADAQGWVTLDFYRNFKVLQGKWNSALENAYIKTVNGEKLSKSEMAYFMPIKSQLAGHYAVDDMHIPAFHKMSWAVLHPEMIKDTYLEDIHNRMMKQNLQYFVFESGSKITSITKDGKYDKFYADNQTETPLDKNYEFTKNPVYLKHLKEQVEIAPELHDEVKFPTQLRKLLFSNLYDKGKAISPILEEIRNKYNGAIKDLSKAYEQELYNKLGLEKQGKDIIFKDPQRFVKEIQRQVDQRELNDNIKNFFEWDTVKNDFKYPMSASPNLLILKNLLGSMINRRLVNQYINGDMLVQVSSAGLRKAQDPTLKFYEVSSDNKVRRMQVKIAMNPRYQGLFDLQHMDGTKINTLERLNESLKNPEFTKVFKKQLTLIGVRIPTQAINSIEYMEIAEFLPEQVGNIIVVPSELVAKSGSDFDIDKLVIMQYNIENNGELTNKSNSKDNIKILQNNLISTIDNALENSERFDQFINPNSTDLIDPIILADDKQVTKWRNEYNLAEANNDKVRMNEILSELPMKAKYMFSTTGVITQDTSFKNTATIRESSERNKFQTGLELKSAVGVSATNVTFLQLINGDNLQVNNNYINQYGQVLPYKVKLLEGYTDKQEEDFKNNIYNYQISRVDDENGDNKSLFAEQMVNLDVDALNNGGLLVYAGARLDLHGLMFTLNFYGVTPEKIFHYINQPIVKLHVQNKLANKSIYSKIIGKENNTGIRLLYDIINQGNNKITLIRQLESLEEKSGVDILTIHKNNDKKIKRLNIDNFLSNRNEFENFSEASALFKVINDLPTIFDLQSLKNNSFGNISEDNLLHQTSIMMNFLDMDNLSRMFRKAQSSLNFDTNKTKDGIQAAFKENELDTMINSNLFKNLEDIANNSSISSFKVQPIIREIFDKFLPIISSKSFTTAAIDFLNEYENIKGFIEDDTRDKIISTITDDFIRYIYLTFGELETGESIAQYTIPMFLSSNNGKNFYKPLRKSLSDEGIVQLYKNYNLVQRVKNIKNQINNGFLNDLSYEYINGFWNIKLTRNDISSQADNMYIEEFEKLANYNSENPELNTQVRNLAKDLALAAFTQSGLSKSNLSFTDIVPNELYVPIVSKAIDKYNNLVNNSQQKESLIINSFIDKFKRNNVNLLSEYLIAQKRSQLNKATDENGRKLSRSVKEGYLQDFIKGSISDSGNVIGLKNMTGLPSHKFKLLYTDPNKLITLLNNSSINEQNNVSLQNTNQEENDPLTDTPITNLNNTREKETPC